MTMKSRLLVGSIIVLLFAGFIGKRLITKPNVVMKSVPYYNTADCMPTWIPDPNEAKRSITHIIGDFTCFDQTGATITRKTILGKIHIANFIFTTCAGLCPQMSHQFKILQDSLIRDTNVVLLSFSVTPQIDSVSRLKDYGEMMGAIPSKWHLLTGDKQAIYDLARKSYFAEEAAGISKDSSQFLHTEHFILADQTGRIRGIYNGTLRLESERLLEDIRTLVNEK
jgi:protein SCO1/2